MELRADRDRRNSFGRSITPDAPDAAGPRRCIIEQGLPGDPNSCRELLTSHPEAHGPGQDRRLRSSRVVPPLRPAVLQRPLGRRRLGRAGRPCGRGADLPAAARAPAASRWRDSVPSTASGSAPASRSAEIEKVGSSWFRCAMVVRASSSLSRRSRRQRACADSCALPARAEGTPGARSRRPRNAGRHTGAGRRHRGSSEARGVEPKGTLSIGHRLFERHRTAPVLSQELQVSGSFGLYRRRARRRASRPRRRRLGQRRAQSLVAPRQVGLQSDHFADVLEPGCPRSPWFAPGEVRGVVADIGQDPGRRGPRHRPGRGSEGGAKRWLAPSGFGGKGIVWCSRPLSMRS